MKEVQEFKEFQYVNAKTIFKKGRKEEKREVKDKIVASMERCEIGNAFFIQRDTLSYATIRKMLTEINRDLISADYFYSIRKIETGLYIGKLPKK